jgi:hypothetical protein
MLDIEELQQNVVVHQAYFRACRSGASGGRGHSATISGIVRDSTGAGLAATNAELKLKQPPHTTFSLQTDNEGEFRFTALTLGTYTLKLVQPGFRGLTSAGHGALDVRMLNAKDLQEREPDCHSIAS